MNRESTTVDVRRVPGFCEEKDQLMRALKRTLIRSREALTEVHKAQDVLTESILDMEKGLLSLGEDTTVIVNGGNENERDN